MEHIRLAHKNDALAELFEQETENRISEEYTDQETKEILRNMLTDTDAAISYANRVREIKTAVKEEIEEELGFSVDVGFDPESNPTGVAARVEDLETATGELTEALEMILEGVTE